MHVRPQTTKWERHVCKAYGAAFALALASAVFGALCGVRRGWLLGAGLLLGISAYILFYSLNKLEARHSVWSFMGIVLMFASPSIGFLLKWTGVSSVESLFWAFAVFVVGVSFSLLVSFTTALTRAPMDRH